MKIAQNIILFIVAIAVAWMGGIYIRLGFDSDFEGARRQDLIFQGCVLLIIGLASAKYFINSKY